MGGAFSRNSTRIRERVQNNFFSNTDNRCFSQVNEDITGNTLNLTGNFNDIDVFSISGEQSTSCTINQQITQSVTNILQAQAQQQAKTTTDIFNDGVLFSSAVNSTDLQQSITNNITNINANTCNSTITNSISNNTMSLAGSSNQLRAFNIDTDPNATCAINNLVSQEGFNSQQGSTDQDAENIGLFASVITAIVVVIVVGIVLIVLVFTGGRLASAFFSSSGSGAGAAGGAGTGEVSAQSELNYAINEVLNE